MAKEKQPELGIKNPYDARFGITIGKFRGIQLDHDQSMIPDEALVDATNVRAHDGIVLSRFGQSTPLNSQASGCIQGLIDVNGGGPRFVLAMVRLTTLADKSDVDLFDRNLTPQYSQVTDPPTNQRLSAQPAKGQLQLGGGTLDDQLPRYAFFWWNGQIVFDGGDHKLYRFIFPEDDLSLDSVQVEPLFDLRVGGTTTTFDVASMCALPDTDANATASNDPRRGKPLYFGSVGGGVFAYVNGEMVQLLADGTFTSRVIVFEFHNRLYASGRQDVRVQQGWLDGDSPTSTTWTVVAMPVGVSDFLSMCAVEFYGSGWIGGADVGASPSGRILRLDDFSGTPVLTVANDGTLSPVNLISVDDFGIAAGKVYAAYRSVPSVTEVADFAEMGNSGTIGTPLGLAWSEDGQVIRLVGNNSDLYVSAWTTGGTSGGGAESAIYQYDGSSTVKIADIVNHTPPVSPFDMVSL